MAATGNEPVKLSQLKSAVPGIALRKFDFTITNSNDPVQLPFAPDWGINVRDRDGGGSYTACFMDYGKTVQLLSLMSLAQKNVEIWLFYAGNAEAMSEKLAHLDASYSYTVTSYDTNGTVFSSIRSLIDNYDSAEGYSSRLQLVNPTTIYVNWPFLFINLIFEK